MSFDENEHCHSKVCEEVTRKYDYIRSMFADFNGINRGKIFHSSHINHIIHGSSIYAGTIALGPRTDLYIMEEVKDQYFNGLLKGDITSIRELPWAGNSKHRIAGIIGETAWPDGSLQPACPRYIARRQIERLSEMGVDLKSSFEAEMMLFKPNNEPAFDSHDYLSMEVATDLEPFLLDFDKNMRTAGVDIECLHMEFGPGQVEAVLHPSWGIKTADDMFMLKHGAKEIAKQHGYKCSFMSNHYDTVGSIGSHYNFSLWDRKKGTNMFSNVDAENKLSEFACHWIAGLVKHADALTAICCPTVNCYRRLHNFVIPDFADWAIDNRNVTFRVKNSSPSSTYMENRLPSALCNPYLVLAATIVAGLDGVTDKLTCPPEGREGVKPLPYNFTESLAALENDTAMKEGLGDQFVKWFCGNKREIDLTKLRDYDPKANDQAERRKAEIYLYDKFM